MQRVSIEQRRCNTCRELTRHERHSTALGMGDLIMVLCTSGLWMFAWWWLRPGYRCSLCGRKNS